MMLFTWPAGRYIEPLLKVDPEEKQLQQAAEVGEFNMGCRVILFVAGKPECFRIGVPMRKLTVLVATKSL